MARERLDVPVKYRRGHTYVRRMEPVDMFCPACASRVVWVEDGPGDYYQGPDYYCVSCGSSWCIQGPNPPYDGKYPSDDVSGQVVRALRVHLYGEDNA